jgi:hypothetical protein
VEVNSEDAQDSGKEKEDLPEGQEEEAEDV